MQQVTRSSHVGLESTNDDVTAYQGHHGGNRNVLETRNYPNQTMHMHPRGGEGDGASPIQD